MAEKELNFEARLLAVQTELKAPKDKANKFGGFMYRSAEGILEAVKPLLDKNGLLMLLTDEVVPVANRIYIKSTATIKDTKSDKAYSVSAYAREEESKKGMDGSQITGSASSYARKYALNGLLLIDDNKDADTDEYARQASDEKEESEPLITKNQIAIMKKIAAEKGQTLDEENIKGWTMKHASEVIAKYKGGKK